MQPKILEGVATTTTLCDRLVELHILYFGPLKTHVLGILESLDSLCGLLWLPHLPHG